MHWSEGFEPDQDAVEDLAASIARGDLVAAATALEVAFRDHRRARERIARGRLSRAARPRPPVTTSRAAAHQQEQRP